MREGKLLKSKRTAKSQKESDIMDKKMTYSECLQIAIETINAIDLFDTFEDAQIDRIEKARDRMVELKASIEKRNASKSTGTAKAGTKAAKDDAEKAAFRDAVSLYVRESDEGLRASQVAEKFGVSTQKASAALRKLVELGEIEKNVGEKGVSLFNRIGLNG